MSPRIYGLCLVLLILFPIRTYAQTEGADEPLLDQFRSRFKSEAFSLGLFSRILARYEVDGESGNGFQIAVARIQARGRLDRGFSYFVQTEFVSSSVLHDARLSYQLSPFVRLDAGLFKTPYSAGFILSSSRTEFIRRSAAESELSLNRQVGAALHGSSESGLFDYDLGMFNGNGRTYGGNDNNSLLYLARFTWHPSASLDLGINGAYADEEVRGIDGPQVRWGGDLRFETERVLLSGEALFVRSSPESAVSRNVAGYHATLGYMLAPGRHQVLVRQDSFFDDAPGMGDRHFVSLGYNNFISGAYKLQINYFVPMTTASGHHEILVGFQIAI